MKMILRVVPILTLFLGLSCLFLSSLMFKIDSISCKVDDQPCSLDITNDLNSLHTTRLLYRNLEENLQVIGNIHGLSVSTVRKKLPSTVTVEFEKVHKPFVFEYAGEHVALFENELKTNTTSPENLTVITISDHLSKEQVVSLLADQTLNNELTSLVITLRKKEVDPQSIIISNHERLEVIVDNKPKAIFEPIQVTQHLNSFLTFLNSNVSLPDGVKEIDFRFSRPVIRT